MKVTGHWIENTATQQVIRLLEQVGHQAFFVGGCVRNALLGEPVGDIDIATDAHPDTVMELAGQGGLKAIPTGIDHGTVTVVADGIPHEITTFRKDIMPLGRHAVVAFSNDVSQDAARRDFTMNALYADARGDVIDPLGGLPDLLNRHVRFIQDPGQRIREDYLRILRFFRFHAWYGNASDGMDAEALAAIAEHLDGLGQISRERIGAEMIKLLASVDPAPTVASMRSCGVLGTVLPGADDRPLAPLIHCEQQAGVKPDPIVRLTALGGVDSAERLRLSNAQARQLDLLRNQVGEVSPPLELGYRLGQETGLAVLLLRAAVFETPFDEAVIKQLQQGEVAEFPVTAEDLMPDLTGKALGQALRSLEREWLNSGCTMTREELLQNGKAGT